MEKEKRFKCCKCDEGFDNRKDVKKLNCGYFCKKCEVKKRKEKRDYILHEVAGVIRRDNSKKKEDYVPKNCGAKEKVKKARGYSKLGLYLTRDEKYFLYKKLSKQGFSKEEIRERIDKSVEKIKEIILNLKPKITNREDLNKKFKEEFAKLCEKYR